MKDLHPWMQVFFSCRIDTVTGMWYDFLRNKRDKGSGGMKVLWGTNLNPIKDGDRFDGEAFVAAETDTTLLRTLDDAVEQEEKIIMDAELPWWLSLLKWLGGMAFLFCCLVVLKANAALADCYHYAPGIFWAAGIGGPVWLVLWLVEKHRQRSLSTSKERAAIRQRAKKALKACYDALDVPEDAVEVDVLAMHYRLRDGEVKPVKSGGEFSNTPVYMWRKEAALCIADASVRMEIPLSCVTGLASRRGTVRLDDWNKRRSWRQYKAQGVYAGKQGIFVKSYCILSMQYMGETYQLWLPGHEKEIIEELTGCQAVEQQLSRADHKRNESIARREREKPKSRWHLPENFLEYFMPDSDDDFKEEHPRLYPLLVILGCVAFIAPLLTYCFWIGEANLWALLGAFGAFIVGIGLFNIVGAILHQYLGHIVTLGCFLLGGVMIWVSLLLI